MILAASQRLFWDASGAGRGSFGLNSEPPNVFTSRQGAPGGFFHGRRTDLILMDLRVPGLNGAGAARRIRTEDGPNAAIPILAFSADIDQAREAGLFDGAIGTP